MTNNFTLSGGVTQTSQRDISIDELAPNNYLTIVWKDTKTGNIINTLDIDNEQSINFTNQLNGAIDNAIRNNNVTYAGQNRYINIESIAKYIAQNNIPAGTKRQVINALIGLISGAGKKTPDDVINLFLNVFGTIADKTARNFGWTDPHEIFSQVAGQNVITVLSQLGKQAKNFLDNCIRQFNGEEKTNVSSADGNKESKKQYVGLLLGITTSDNESYENTIPRKKVEDGSDYTTHLLPQPFKKDFTVKLTNKVLTSDFKQTDEINAIEYTKNKMIDILNSKTLFDIYIRLNDKVMYKRSNVTFSSLSFNKDEEIGNSYTATFTIEPINNFKIKTFVSTKKYGSTGSSAGTGGKGTNRKQDDKSSNGNSFNVGFSQGLGGDRAGVVQRTREEMIKEAKNRGYWLKYSPKGNPEWRYVKPSEVVWAIESQLRFDSPSAVQGPYRKVLALYVDTLPIVSATPWISKSYAGTTRQLKPNFIPYGSGVSYKNAKYFIKVP